ncbi:MAG: hypothetical protein KAX15_04680, partial [Candidatus Omnitrophica bacterium]|nr:hypothetical protein [Candidatus Omnitrophota bacterium]
MKKFFVLVMAVIALGGCTTTQKGTEIEPIGVSTDTIIGSQPDPAVEGALISKSTSSKFGVALKGKKQNEPLRTKIKVQKKEIRKLTE